MAAIGGDGLSTTIMHALEQEIGKDRFHRYFAPGSASLEVSA